MRPSSPNWCPAAALVRLPEEARPGVEKSRQTPHRAEDDVQEKRVLVEPAEGVLQRRSDAPAVEQPPSKRLRHFLEGLL